MYFETIEILLALALISASELCEGIAASFFKSIASFLFSPISFSESLGGLQVCIKVLLLQFWAATKNVGVQIESVGRAVPIHRVWASQREFLSISYLPQLSSKAGVNP